MTDKSITEKAVKINMKVKSTGATRKDNEISTKILAELGAQAETGWFSKRIYGDYLKPVQNAASAVRKIYRTKTRAWDDTSRICPLVDPTNPNRLYFREFEDSLRAAIGVYDAAVEKFLAEAPQAQELDKARLGAGWKSEDYMSIEDLRKKFGVEYEVSPIPSDDFLTGMSDEVVGSIREKIKAQNEAHLGALSMNILGNVRDLVEILLEKVATEAGVVKADTMKKVLETMDTLRMFPTTPETSAVVETINNSIRRFSADAINSNPIARDLSKQSLTAIKAGLNGIVGTTEKSEVAEALEEEFTEDELPTPEEDEQILSDMEAEKELERLEREAL